MHRIAAFARIIDAAQRGYGYTPADMPKYARHLSDELHTCAGPGGGGMQGVRWELAGWNSL